jgi:hypothetical protein
MTCSIALFNAIFISHHSLLPKNQIKYLYLKRSNQIYALHCIAYCYAGTAAGVYGAMESTVEEMRGRADWVRSAGG